MDSLDSPAPRRPAPLSSGPFVCASPNCGKSFLRKEHLNRHRLQHTSLRPHKCFICGRSFTRRSVVHLQPSKRLRSPGSSDILNRHVLQHNVPPDGPKRTSRACQSCRRRKTKCDSNTPCASCTENGETCVREPTGVGMIRPTTRSLRQGRTEEGQHVEVSEEEVPHEDVGGVVSPEDSSPAQGDWSAPASQRESLPSRLDACISITPGIPLPATPLLLGYPLGLPRRLSESGPGFQPDRPSEMPIEGNIGFSGRASGRMSATESSIPDSSQSLQQGSTMSASPGQSATLSVHSAEFHHFHRLWSFLHLPTLTTEKYTPLLTMALASLSKWMQNSECDNSMLTSINQELTQSLMQKVAVMERPTTDILLQTLQALVITLIYAILGDAPVASLNWAAQWTDIAISTFRRLGVLGNRWLPEDQQHSVEEGWVLVEQMKRLVYTVLRIDSYLCIILGRPPTLRYQEIALPLIVSDDLWRAETREARTQLHWYEPAGRIRTAFSTNMRDGLETQGFMTGYLRMPPLSLEHKHLSLCAFLSELWGISKEAHQQHHRSYRSPETNRTADPVRIWKRYLQDWRVNVEETERPEDLFFAGGSGSSDPFLGISLTLYHLESLQLYANMGLLEHNRCCVHCQEADVENVINTWAHSADGRQAVYHAAQLKRVYEREGVLYRPVDRQLGNVLGPAGLLASAIILCLYSSKVSSLNVAEGDALSLSAGAIELTQPRLIDTPEYERWISQGGLATVGGELLYEFSVPHFSSWYRSQLISFPVYSSRLVAFLLTLKI
ncbi:uncharacterized protein N7459_007007 [Penicillium hispanicum]|uniref:uncharacterized protein n=1 Tax=Penicillium hispanicum TaxID=1080232 RepID=UPI002541B2A4|nr:uncharacterized protein N7459_007007 [Penicillium hispanicum]KAJ5578043.1 hypothetical protein N7459_007007 [Penicillium hispanicum]